MPDAGKKKTSLSSWVRHPLVTIGVIWTAVTGWILFTLLRLFEAFVSFYYRQMLRRRPATTAATPSSPTPRGAFLASLPSEGAEATTTDVSAAFTQLKILCLVQNLSRQHTVALAAYGAKADGAAGGSLVGPRLYMRRYVPPAQFGYPPAAANSAVGSFPLPAVLTRGHHRRSSNNLSPSSPSSSGAATPAASASMWSPSGVGGGTAASNPPALGTVMLVTLEGPDRRSSLQRTVSVLAKAIRCDLVEHQLGSLSRPNSVGVVVGALSDAIDNVLALTPEAQPVILAGSDLCATVILLVLQQREELADRLGGAILFDPIVGRLGDGNTTGRGAGGLVSGAASQREASCCDGGGGERDDHSGSFALAPNSTGDCSFLRRAHPEEGSRRQYYQQQQQQAAAASSRGLPTLDNSMDDDAAAAVGTEDGQGSSSSSGDEERGSSSCSSQRQRQRRKRRRSDGETPCAALAASQQLQRPTSAAEAHDEDVELAQSRNAFRTIASLKSAAGIIDLPALLSLGQDLLLGFMIDTCRDVQARVGARLAASPARDWLPSARQTAAQPGVPEALYVCFVVDEAAGFASDLKHFIARQESGGAGGGEIEAYLWSSRTSSGDVSFSGCCASLYFALQSVEHKVRGLLEQIRRLNIAMEQSQGSTTPALATNAASYQSLQQPQLPDDDAEEGPFFVESDPSRRPVGSRKQRPRPRRGGGGGSICSEGPFAGSSPSAVAQRLGFRSLAGPDPAVAEGAHPNGAATVGQRWYRHTNNAQDVAGTSTGNMTSISSEALFERSSGADLSNADDEDEIVDENDNDARDPTSADSVDDDGFVSAVSGGMSPTEATPPPPPRRRSTFMRTVHSTTSISTSTTTTQEGHRPPSASGRTA